ncbi:hypothetical protein SFC08_14610 [Lysinibacillus halotolerans]
MKKALINELDQNKKMAASTYKATITYADNEVMEKEIVQYSFSDVFEVIKEGHENENNKEVTSILIEVIK